MRPLIDLIENANADHADALERTGFWGAQGAGCLIGAKSTGRMLIGHRSSMVEQPGTWGTFGGAIDPGEKPIEAIVREVKEETGYTGSVVDRIPLFVFKKGSFSYFNYLVVVEDEFKPRLDWENQDAQWFEFGDWPSPIHFGLKALLDDPKSHVILSSFSS